VRRICGSDPGEVDLQHTARSDNKKKTNGILFNCIVISPEGLFVLSARSNENQKDCLF